MNTILIKAYKIDRLHRLGYTFKKLSDLSYHHLIVPTKDGGSKTKENGAVLTRNASHEYLHLIERIDSVSFNAIREVLIDENKARAITIENLKRIREVLLQFESEHKDDIAKKGPHFYVIRDDFIEKRIKL